MFFWILPASVFASVSINEVAWMGSVDSANDEWIELYNSGDSDISLDGWTLEDGMNFEVILAGTVGAGQYAVLERTDDASAPGSAFLLYVGALANIGATLVLRSEEGAIKDQVAGGENWENIGGDNTTKETAQYTSSGWITATPTPGKTNASAEVMDGSEEDDGTQGSGSDAGIIQKSSSKKKVVQLELPDVELSLAMDAPDIIYVNQQVDFSVEPSGIGKTFIDSLQYQWNFGDAYTASSKEVSHVFLYPGEYVVTVHAGYARHEQLARTTVTVLPVAFSMTKNIRGDIQIHNDAKYEINISGYMLVGAKNIVFPEHTILLPNATITLPKEKILSQKTSYVQLLDTNQTLVAALSLAIESGIAPKESIQTIAAADTIQYIQENQEDFVFPYDSVSEPKEESVFGTTSIDAEPVSAAVEETKRQFPTQTLPLFGLVGILSVGLLSVYIRKV